MAFYTVLAFCGMLRWNLTANIFADLYTDENRSNTSHGRQSILETVSHNPWAVHESIDWFKGKNTGKSHSSWENLWFPVDFPLSQPIE